MVLGYLGIAVILFAMALAVVVALSDDDGTEQVGTGDAVLRVAHRERADKYLA